MNIVTRSLGLAALLVAIRFPAPAQNGFTDAEAVDIKAFLQESFGKRNAGMVVGLIDERGSRIISAGKLDNGTDQEVNGDTLFEIGSVTKTFTSLLALEMAARGEVNLNDPVAKYLPTSVTVPTHGGKEITLLHLAAQESGLPFNADNLSGKGPESYDSYTVEKMYAFLSSYTLMNDPGAKFQYSNLGMSLLGHVMELKAGTHFESLVVNRIFRPLRMDSTCITLTPELNSRLASGHDENGKRTEKYNLQVMAGAGALLSTASDLAKFVSANLGLTPSDLKPLLEKMQEIRHQDSEFGRTAMPWWDSGVYQPAGMDLLGHGGGTWGSSAFIGFDRKQRRGVVVLANQRVVLANTYPVGWRILQRAPLKGQAIATIVPLQVFVGVGTALDRDQKAGVLRIKQIIPNSPAAQAGIPAGLVIQSIDGVAVAGKSLAECVDLIRGPAGSKVRLGLFNLERNETTTVELTRQRFLVGN